MPASSTHLVSLVLLSYAGTKKSEVKAWTREMPGLHTKHVLNNLQVYRAFHLTPGTSTTYPLTPRCRKPNTRKVIH